jgi:glycosyltransferase involved in cell wall biosynthesis
MIMVKEYGSPKRPKRGARTLREDGHEVTIVARNRFNESRKEILENATLIRLPYIKFLGRKANHILTLPLPLNPIYLVCLAYLVVRMRIDVMHIHDLPMVLPAIYLGRLLRIPVVFDMHENYPAMAETWKNKGVLNSVLIRSGAYRWLERFCGRRSDYVLVTCNEQQERLLRMGVSPEKIQVVGNLPELKILRDWDHPDENGPSIDNGFTLLYTGILKHNRGLDTVIRGVSVLRDAIPDIKLLIVGNGEARDSLVRVVRELGLERYVRFEGWVDYETFPQYIRRTDVCVIPHPSTEHINTTVPNKLFEFMYLSKPLIVSDAAPLERIAVREARAGIAFPASDFRAFANLAVALYDDKDLRQRLGQNGREYVTSRGNWEQESKKLSRVYRELTKRAAGHRPTSQGKL